MGIANTYSPIDPASYATMDIVEVPDEEVILAARMGTYVATWAKYDPPMAAQYDVANLEFDPHKIVQETDTVYEGIVLNRVNQAARACTTAFATGRDLDAIASRLPFPVQRVASEIYDYQNALYPERVAKDARFRARMWLAPFKIARGSTAQGYAFDAMSLVPDARDVSVGVSRTPQQVSSVVTLMMNRWDNPTPTKAETLAAFKSLDAPDLVQNTDVLAVQGCVTLDKHYTFNIFFLPYTDHGAIMKTIQANGEKLFTDELFYLGRDHGRQQVEGLCNLPGVHHVVLEGFDGEVVSAEDHQVLRATFSLKDAGTAK